jgi:DNA-binding NtrC family response regulator
VLVAHDEDSALKLFDARQSQQGRIPAKDPVLVGTSPAIAAVRAYTLKVAASDASVVVTGETGTGKEIVARLIHRHSRRRGLFVPLNCAAIPDGLLESELFGHERGAFTGAHAGQDGKLRLADGGSIFFDEVADLSGYAQAKLLRAIETREIYRLGGKRAVAFDARVIAATNVDLEDLVREGRFRKDLFFRLSVAHVHVPPLRERLEDVPALLEHCVRELRDRSDCCFSGFGADALEHLMGYAWPGNVRELRNLVELMAVDVTSGEVRAGHLPARFTAGRRVEARKGERERLLAALETTNWNKSRAAQQLQWSRMTLYRKMAKYQIGDSAILAAPGPPARIPL